MSKLVLVKYGSRRIPIIYETSGHNDFEAMMFVFKAIASRDDHLSKKEHLMPIFTYYHDVFECEVELNAKTQMPLKIEVDLTYRAAEDTPRKKDHFLESQDEQQVLVMPRQLFVVEPDVNETNVITGVEVDTPVFVDGLLYQNVDGELQCLDVEAPQSKHSSSTTQVASKSLASGSNSNACYPLKLACPTKLPQWSQAVLNYIQNKTAILHIHDIVREATYHLQVICPRPSSKDYEMYSRTICMAIPELKNLPGTHDDDNVALSKMISAKMRNDRHRDAIKNMTVKSRANALSVARIACAENEADLADGIPIMELLKQLTIVSKDTQLIKDIQKKTFHCRREEINGADSISATLLKWPVFKIPEIFIYEHQLFYPEHFENFDHAWTVLINKLKAIYELGDDSEAGHITLIAQLESSLHPRSAKNSLKACNVVKVGTNIPDKTSFNAPALWAAVMGEEVLQAQIYCENDLLCEVQDTEPKYLISTLMSVYHCFNRGYPEVAKQFYEFLAFALYGVSSFTGNATYSKFKAKYLKA